MNLAYQQLNAIIPIWKPIDWSSFDVVKKVRGIIKQKKVGHTGTLDPFAEGLLLICTGKMTSMVESLMNQKKEYTGQIQLGVTTETLDPESPFIKGNDTIEIGRNQLEDISGDFIGEIMQVPPMYSALKYKGKPLYKYAREGEIINIPPRPINIYKFEIINIYKNSFTFKILCGRGTYIRSIARDFAIKLGTKGYLSSLKRTRIGKYSLNNAIRIENLKEWLSTKV